MKYIITTAQSAMALEIAVNGFLTDGWEPLGGVCLHETYRQWENERKGYTESETDVTWAQALVKRS